MPITDVGMATSISDPGSSLVCKTEEVNTQCCRNRDGGNVGEWQYPNGTQVLRRRNNRGGNYSRSGFTQQVRLNRRNDAIGPTGEWTCTVPREEGSREEGCGDSKHSASITLGMF